MLNVVAIMGRLARDPELRQTTTGKSVASFRIACDRGRRDANGQSQADWIDVVAWRGTAEVLCNYADKGRMIGVEGRLQMRDWTDKDGNKRRSAEVIADNVYFGDSKRDDATTGQQFAYPQADTPQAAYQQPSGYAAECTQDYVLIDDDDGQLPF